MILKVFTYGQYIKCIHKFRLNAVMQLAEDGTEYKLEQTEEIDTDDKLIKNILQNKKEATEFINQFLEPREEIKEEELIQCANRYITRNDKAKEVVIVYKLKNQEVFFLIEHQSSIDHNMSYRMLNYCLELIRNWGRNKKIGKSINYPIVVPIVIYTGNQKWKVIKKQKETQIDDTIRGRYKINLAYNLIDINKISKQDLLAKNTVFAYTMFLEKAESFEQLIENFNGIVKVCKDSQKIQELADQFNYLLDQILSNETEAKVGEKNMSTLMERLRKEALEHIKQGKEEEQIEIVKNMLGLNLSEKVILQTTKIKREKLEKIKKELAITNDS